MNQTGAKQLVLNADEARNLHADIYILLANLAETQAESEPVANAQTFMDGGGFK
jgi:hypothetical protein